MKQLICLLIAVCAGACSTPHSATPLHVREVAASPVAASNDNQVFVANFVSPVSFLGDERILEVNLCPEFGPNQVKLKVMGGNLSDATFRVPQSTPVKYSTLGWKLNEGNDFLTLQPSDSVRMEFFMVILSASKQKNSQDPKDSTYRRTTEHWLLAQVLFESNQGWRTGGGNSATKISFSPIHLCKLKIIGPLMKKTSRDADPIILDPSFQVFQDGILLKPAAP